MSTNPTSTIISYSHDSREHKENIRFIANILRQKYNIDVFADFYDEDMPHGKLITDFMHTISSHDKVVIILTPQYKKKADEGVGGVGYEGMLITSQLYNDLGSQKFIPVVIDNGEINIEEYFPNFLGKLRRAIFRNDFHDSESFIEGIARAIENKPKKPKPPLGSSGWMKTEELEVTAELIDIPQLLDEKNSRILFRNALNFTKKGNTTDFNILKKDVMDLSFSLLLKTRDEYENTSLNQKDLPEIMDKFVDIVRPIYLICYAGYLSSHAAFIRQEGVMYDLLAIDEWNNRSRRTYVVIQSVPELLVYVYHHIYGALHINNDKLTEIVRLLKSKLPKPNKYNEYSYLFKMHSITGWVESLGRDCFDSFRFLLNSYARWDWLKIIFKSESEFKKNLVAYQLIIHLLNFFDYLDEGDFSDEVRYGIPPSFVIAEKEYISFAINLVIKESDFFKAYLKERGIVEKSAHDNWPKWVKGMGGYRSVGHFYNYLPDNFIENLLM